MEAERAREIAQTLIRAYPERELPNLLTWSRAILEIRRSELPVHAKVLQVGRITKEMGVTGPFLRHLVNELKRVGWDERTKTMRGVVGGAGIGLIASIGGPMAGVAALGGAIAVPVVLLGAGAGAVLMAIVEDIQRNK